MSDADRGPAGGQTGTETERILLAVAGDRDRELLAERLSDRYEVVAGEPDGDQGAVDLCVVDAQSYRRTEETLAARRRGAVGYLPVLLLVPEQDRSRPNAWLTEALDGPADDVLVVPAPKHELDARVEALLRVRRQSQQLALYRRAMDETTVGITISDPARSDNPLVYANDSFCEITGYDRAAALGRNCRFLQGPDTDEETVAEVRAAIDDERPVSVEILNYRPDGEPFWNRLTVAPVRDRSGAVSHFVGFQQDVTDRVERGRALEEYETIVETATEPICVLDPEGRFQRVNEAMVETLGYSREELVGSHASAVACDEAVERGERQIREVLDGERDRASFEASLVGADGIRREYVMTVSVLRGPEGFAGTTLVAHDVTDLREHQRRLSVLDRVLRHNLRNKLNVVVERAADIRRSTDDESVRDAAAAIERSGSDLMAHGEAVRQFEGAVDPRQTERERIDVVETVERALEGIRATHPAATVETELPATAAVMGDETLTLAVEELLESAADHESTAEGDATVVRDVAALGDPQTEADGPVVLVRVTDDPDEGVVEIVVGGGLGISEVGRRALERGAETQLEHTAGIGLWLVRWAIENVGGEISVAESDPQGTVVTVRLPRAE
ncbi:MAG: PAS domain S-box protein [Haloferacaceae archaeon]